MGATSIDCGCGCEGSAAFPANPATALHYHFGMLLGVEDLRVEQAFHIGRLHRHQRELHGHGVVRGMKVTFDAAAGVLRVSPGFAVDLLGREIEILRPQCLDLAAFIAANAARLPALAAAAADGVDLDLVLRAGACLERPVQAIAPACNGSAADLAYSRLTERAELDLVAAAPDAEEPPDPLTALCAALVDGSFAPDPDSPEQTQLAVLAALAAEPGAGATERAALIRQSALVASLDAPAPAPAVVMEEVHLTLARLTGVKAPVQPGDPASLDAIRCDLRRLLLPQGLVSLLLPEPEPVGPVVTEATLSGLEVSVTFDRAVAPGSLVEAAFQLLDLTAATLAPVDFDLAAAGPAAAPTGATLTLAGAPEGALRLTVMGTGENPIVDSAFSALGQQRPGEDGRNFVTTL